MAPTVTSTHTPAASPEGPRDPAAGSRPGYRALLRTPGALAFLLPGFAARLPFAMLTLSVVLLLKHTTGSYGTAGAVAAVTGVSTALAAPLSGRLADRWGRRAVLVPGVLLHVLAAGALAALALGHAPVWALFAAAVPSGASVPQIGPMVRARWAEELRSSPLLGTATAFESVTDELTFVLGPLLATALCTGVHPAAGLLGEAVLTLTGGLLFAFGSGGKGRTPVHDPAAPDRARTAGAERPPRPVSALRAPGVRVLAAAFLGIGTVFGGMQVAVAAFSESLGEPGLNGVLYGVFAAGNMISGALCGMLTFRLSPERRLLRGYAALTLAAATLVAAGTAPVLGALGAIVGMCVAPAIVTGYTLVERLVPAGARTEAFTWLTGAVALGQAGAVTAAGLLEDRYRDGAGFLVPLAGTALALTTLVLLRSRLVPPRTVARGGLPGGVVEEAGDSSGFGHRSPTAVD